MKAYATPEEHLQRAGIGEVPFEQETRPGNRETTGNGGGQREIAALSADRI
jgi:hypothetical protein